MVSKSYDVQLLLRHYYKLGVLAGDAWKRLCVAEGDGFVGKTTAYTYYKQFEEEGIPISTLAFELPALVGKKKRAPRKVKNAGQDNRVAPPKPKKARAKKGKSEKVQANAQDSIPNGIQQEVAQAKIEQDFEQDEQVLIQPPYLSSSPGFLDSIPSFQQANNVQLASFSANPSPPAQAKPKRGRPKKNNAQSVADQSSLSTFNALNVISASCPPAFQPRQYSKTAFEDDFLMPLPVKAPRLKNCTFTEVALDVEPLDTVQQEVELLVDDGPPSGVDLFMLPEKKVMQKDAFDDYIELLSD